MLNKNFSLWVVLGIISGMFAAEKAPVSYLELFPGKGIEPVKLGHPYYHITDDERVTVKFVKEGNYTYLTDQECALVGPLQPCQLLVLYLSEITVVAHLVYHSNVSDLLDSIKKDFPHVDFSHVTGELFTNKMVRYDQSWWQINGKDFSYKNFYQNRTQIEELKRNKDLVVNKFNIADRSQILAHQFTSDKKDFELGYYEVAEMWTFIKNKRVFNTCPIAEKYFGDFDGLSSLEERFQKYETARAQWNF